MWYRNTSSFRANQYIRLDNRMYMQLSFLYFLFKTASSARSRVKCHSLLVTLEVLVCWITNTFTKLAVDSATPPTRD